MTDASHLDRIEQLARIEKMLAGAALASMDTVKRDQDYRHAIWPLIIGAVTAGAGLLAAGAALMVLAIKWVQH